MAARRKPAHRYHHGDLRTALLAAAWSVVSKKGVDALSLRAVADALGVSHAAPSHHFPNKDALVEALREEAWRRFADALSATDGSLAQTGRCYVDFATRHPEQLRLMFRPGHRPSAQGRRAWLTLAEATARHLGKGSAPVDAAVAWAMVHGVSSLLLDARLPDAISKEALVERALVCVAKGLAP